MVRLWSSALGLSSVLGFGSLARQRSLRRLRPLSSEAQSFINGVNSEYESLHSAFESQFWGTKMGLSSKHAPLSGAPRDYSVDELTRTKQAMEGFLGDESKLQEARRLLASGDASESEAKTLRLMTRAFECYIMESASSRALRAEATAIEGRLEAARNAMSLGATIGGAFVEMSSVSLRSRMRVDSDEAARKACYAGLRSIGDFVVDNGFPELVKTRNTGPQPLGRVLQCHFNSCS